MATVSVDECPALKKRKLDEDNEETNNIDNDDQFKNLLDFIPKKILSNNSQRKLICIQGKFTDKEGDALVILEKKAFVETDLQKENNGYLTDSSVLKFIFKNDVYFSYECFPDVILNGLKATIIYPATEKHIVKYSQQNIYIVNETADLYKNITLPHIEKEQFTLEWVYNILDHKSEEDRIVFEDNDPEKGFILLPDLKWDGKSLETLYLVAIVHRREIKSLRDLNGSHLPLLKNIYEKGVKAIEEKYNLPEHQLRIYLHYQPSFYHLHVHFTYLKYDAPGIFAEKAHILSNVISNVELMSDYYQRVTLPFVIRENDNLFSKFEEAGVLKKLPIAD